MPAGHAVTAASRKPLYSHLYAQVLTAIILGILLGYFYPQLGEQMKPFGDAFIQMIKMLIAPIIFCTVVHVAGMEDLKRLRSRRHQGVDLFRGGDDARANCRPCHRLHSATRRWHEC